MAGCLLDPSTIHGREHCRGGLVVEGCNLMLTALNHMSCRSMPVARSGQALELSTLALMLGTAMHPFIVHPTTYEIENSTGSSKLKA
jgi:hypothetical protein